MESARREADGESGCASGAEPRSMLCFCLLPFALGPLAVDVKRLVVPRQVVRILDVVCPDSFKNRAPLILVFAGNF